MSKTKNPQEKVLNVSKNSNMVFLVDEIWTKMEIPNLFEIANMDFLACKICHKIPVFGLGPTLAALNLTYTVHGKA